MAIERFEDIEARKGARELTRAIYRATTEAGFAKDFGLRDQIQRAAVSIMANISEGFDSNSDNEFVRFLRYELRLATETQSHLYVAVDQDYISEEDFNILYKQAAKVQSPKSKVQSPKSKVQSPKVGGKGRLWPLSALRTSRHGKALWTVLVTHEGVYGNDPFAASP